MEHFPIVTALIERLVKTMAFQGGWGYVILFLISYLERVAFVSVIVPGSIVVTLAGFLAAHGYLNIVDSLILVSTGCVAGDVTSYVLARMIGTWYFERHNRLLFVTKKHVKDADRYFREQGGKTIFISRFVGFVSAIVPLSAGMSNFSWKTFLFYVTLGNIAWSLAYTFLGYFFGRSWQALKLWPERLAIVSLLLFLLILANYLLKRRNKSQHAPGQ